MTCFFTVSLAKCVVVVRESSESSVEIEDLSDLSGGAGGDRFPDRVRFVASLKGCRAIALGARND
jgi:hypothetical protein